jgi:hypothetical protein
MVDLTYWSFIAVALVLYRLGEAAKNVVLGKTKKELDEAIKTPWKKNFYETLMLQPVVAGGLMGLLLSATVPEVISAGGIISSVLYFAGAGVLSTWIFDAIKRMVRRFSPSLPEVIPTETE